MKHILKSVTARLAATAAMYPWAVEMLAVIKKVAPKVEGGISGMGSEDGDYVATTTGRKIVQALKAAGYKHRGNPDTEEGIAFMHSKGSANGVNISTNEDVEGSYCLRFFS